MTERAGPSHYGAERQPSGEAKAERMMGEELQRWRRREVELVRRRKGDGEKVRVRLRQATIMTLKRIAERLPMRSWTLVSNCLAATRNQ